MKPTFKEHLVCQTRFSQ